VIGERLKEERERLDMTQPAFAEAAGAKKRTLIDWEKGVSSPTAVQLASLASVGVDVLYVITGQRSQPIEPAQELPRQEQEWLAIFRNSSDNIRAALKAAGDELTKPTRKKDKAA
jgi:Predicted transcriptional regulator